MRKGTRAIQANSGMFTGRKIAYINIALKIDAQTESRAFVSGVFILFVLSKIGQAVSSNLKIIIKPLLNYSKIN
jgi:hypothetical protein